MPLIKGTFGPLSKEEKKTLIEKFTESASEVTKIPQEAFQVYIEELPNDAIGVGGKTVEKMMEEMNK